MEALCSDIWKALHAKMQQVIIEAPLQKGRIAGKWEMIYDVIAVQPALESLTMSMGIASPFADGKIQQ